MGKWTFDQAATKRDLAAFFQRRTTDLRSFGSTVNQTFEAFVFASVVQWYRDRRWKVSIINPINKRTKKQQFKLKFSTRGAPANFSYALAKKKKSTIQIRHQLRVATSAHQNDSGFYANICLDVAVIKDVDLAQYKTYHAVPNRCLITFGEAKHMSAFAELIAGFIGLVHELQLSRLSSVRKGKRRKRWHLAPFLFVSGLLWSTAKGLEFTIQRRKFDIDIYSSGKQLSLAFSK